jgi:hypothetical protein
MRGVPRPRLDRAQRAALRSACIAVLATRAYVVLAGVLAVLAAGADSGDIRANEALAPFGRLGDLLTATSLRYDTGFYLVIALQGYEGGPLRAAFPPLYPLAIGALKPAADPFAASEIGAALLAGLAVSWVAFGVGLYLLHRLVALDFGEQVAHRTVVLLAVFPTSFFFSAVYAESLFLALSVGSIYAGRRGHWWLAGLLGGLAALTRLQGIILLVPLTVLLLYGPRGDRPAGPRRGWRPPHFPPALRHAAPVLLIPVALAAFAAYLWIAIDDPLATLAAQREGWDRHAAIPVVSAYLGLEDAAWAANRVRLGFSPFKDAPTRAALTDAAFFLFAVVGVAGALRRLPLAYSAYALSALLFLLLSVPEHGRERLMSLPRVILVVFPLFIWLGLWADTPRRWWGTLIGSGLLLGGYSALAATWHWVA